MEIKKAETTEDAWELQERHEGLPHGCVQWKGTQVCMDIYCVCGESSHIDSDFVYNVICPYCKRIYFCNGHIELIEIEQMPDGCVYEAS